MKIEFEIVARPSADALMAGRGAGTSQNQPLYEAIARTVETGEALRVPVNGLPLKTLRSTLSGASRSNPTLRNLRIFGRSAKDGSAIYFWAVRRENAGADPVADSAVDPAGTSEGKT